MANLARGPLQVQRHRAGHSNETFFVRAGDREWVLRRPPRGAFLPTAHDVGREFRVLSALAPTGVRVPRPVLWCADGSVIGAPFYLMERIHGDVLQGEPPPWLDAAEDRRRVGEELVDALAELHAVDWRAAGLEGFGKPNGYLRRQVDRWDSQLRLTEPLTRVVPDLHRTGEWLQGHVPAEAEPAVVHGDFKLDNVLFAHGPPTRLVGVLDWEMSTIGDPLADLGWMLSFWPHPDDPPLFALDEGTPTRREGFLRREDLVRRYGSATGREVGDLSFYLVLAVWKLAILLEGSYARHLAGVTDDPLFAALDDAVPALARRARALAS